MGLGQSEIAEIGHVKMRLAKMLAATLAATICLVVAYGLFAGRTATRSVLERCLGQKLPASVVIIDEKSTGLTKDRCLYWVMEHSPREAKEIIGGTFREADADDKSFVQQGLMMEFKDRYVPDQSDWVGRQSETELNAYLLLRRDQTRSYVFVIGI